MSTDSMGDHSPSSLIASVSESDADMEVEGKTAYWIDRQDWESSKDNQLTDFYRADLEKLQKLDVRVSHPFGLEHNTSPCNFADITRETPVIAGDSRTYQAGNQTGKPHLAAVIRHLLLRPVSSPVLTLFTCSLTIEPPKPSVFGKPLDHGGHPADSSLAQREESQR